jgi:putative tryptophan/tyrosine transport system substrate-binding protein
MCCVDRLSRQPQIGQNIYFYSAQFVPADVDEKSSVHAGSELMKRREFMMLLAGSAAAPLVARAQQQSMPVIGFLHAGSPEANVNYVAAFRKGLSEAGYVDKRDVTIEYRWAEDRDDRLPELAADLVRRRVAVIATPGTTQAALAAKAATTTIPIVFSTGGDPVALGLAISFNRPGANVTGIVNTSARLAGKRLGLLRELAPGTKRFAVLVTHDGPLTQATLKDLHAEAPHLGLPVEILYADTADEIEGALTKLSEVSGSALMVGPDALYTNLRTQIVTLAAQLALPAVYSVREFAEAGGLLSYGPSFLDTYKQVGEYAGRILKGEKPSDLPIMQASKVDLVVNLKAAGALGVGVPDKLVAIADEVID